MRGKAIVRTDRALGRARAVVVCGAVSLASTTAWAEPLSDDEAKELAQKVATMIREDRFEEAQAIIDEHELENPDPFVFLHASLEELRGDCETAVRLYERYLELDVFHADAAAAREGIERCRPEAPDPAAPGPVVADPASGAGPEPSPTAGGGSSPSAVDAPRRVEWWRDPLGDSLFFGGVALGVTAGVLGGLAARERRAANRTPSLMEHEASAARHQRYRLAGIVVGSVGAALAVGGIVRWVTLAQRARHEGPAPAKAHTLRNSKGLRTRRLTLEPSGRLAIFF